MVEVDVEKQGRDGPWGEDLAMQNTMVEVDVEKNEDIILTESGACLGVKPGADKKGYFGNLEVASKVGKRFLEQFEAYYYTGHLPVVTSCSFANQVIAHLDLMKNWKETKAY